MHTTLARTTTPGGLGGLPTRLRFLEDGSQSDQGHGAAAVGIHLPLAVKQAAELLAWQEVPQLVVARLKTASAIQKTLRKILPSLKKKKTSPDYGQLFWNPTTKEVWGVMADGDEQSAYQAWHNALRAIPGVETIKLEAETFPKGFKQDDGQWIKIAAEPGGALSWLNKPFSVAGAATGGPSPLSNALVGSLIGGGLGLAGGAIAEQMVPEKYLERGRLRRTLALLGAGVGSLPGLAEGFANSHNANAAGKPLGWKTLITPTNEVPLNPAAQQGSELLAAGHQKMALALAEEGLRGCPLPHAMFLKSADVIGQSTGAFDARPVPMDAFNRAIWNDVSKGVGNPYGTKSPWGDNTQSLHTPPAVGAAASGLVSAIASQYGNPSLLSPQHFIRGLGAAGVDMVTARLAGSVLGALGGLTPQAQEQLQNAGVWSGMIRGVTQSVLGL
jgi:hypothetical protein